MGGRCCEHREAAASAAQVQISHCSNASTLPSPPAEVPSSVSGAISRSSSFRSVADGSPSFSAGLAPGADAWGRDGSVPQSPLAMAGPAVAVGVPAANGSATQQQQQQQQQSRQQHGQPPPPLQIPQGPPEALPILTPVVVVAPTPPAKRQPARDLLSSAAANDAANMSPRGGETNRVHQLERMASGLGPAAPGK